MSLKVVLKMMAELEPEELDALVKTMTEVQAEKAEPFLLVEVKRPPRRKTEKVCKSD